MSRIACLRIPRFQIVVHQKHEPELKNKPFVLLADSSTGKLNLSTVRVFMCSDAASKKFVAAGMKLSEARATYADLIWRQSDRKLYLEEQKKLIAELMSCSPRVSASEPGIFLLDADGLRRMGGEGKLCRDLLKLASRNGFVNGLVGIANSAYAAMVATRLKNQRWQIIPSGKDAAFLSKLPIEHLPLDMELTELLIDLGVKSIGEFAQLPDESIAHRFGKEALQVRQLALGFDKLQLQVPTPEKQYYASADIGGPIEGLNETLFIFKSMFDYLAKELKQNGLCAEELLVYFYNDDDKFDERSIKLVRPSNNAKFLLEVLRLSLEARQLKREFTGVKLFVSRFCKESWEQTRMRNDCSPAPENIADTQALLLQRFVTRLGEDSLVRPVANDQYMSDLAGLWKPLLKNSESTDSAALQLDPFKQANPLSPVAVDIDFVSRANGEQGLAHGPVLKKTPEPVPVFVEIEGGRPVALTYRNRWYHVRMITSAECLSGLWWDQPFRKSYYVALLDQRAEQPNTPLRDPMLVSLVYEHSRRSWLVDGVFD